jgi:hypothetical protein
MDEQIALRDRDIIKIGYQKAKMKEKALESSSGED